MKIFKTCDRCLNNYLPCLGRICGIYSANKIRTYRAFTRGIKNE